MDFYKYNRPIPSSMVLQWTAILKIQLMNAWSALSTLVYDLM